VVVVVVVVVESASDCVSDVRLHDLWYEAPARSTSKGVEKSGSKHDKGDRKGEI
jgi:hypothetical protein